VRAQDIEKLVSVGRPTVSKDAAFAIFAAAHPSIEANRNLSRLYRTDLEARTTRPLTRGIGDSGPQLSPDDSTVAFLRADYKKRPQIWVVEASGGEPVQVTDSPAGVTGFAWSPDGKQFAFTAPVPEQGRYGTVEGLDANAEPPRRITGRSWHANGLGWTNDRPVHVFVVAAADLDAEPLVDPAPAVGNKPVGKRVVANDAKQLTTGLLSHSSVTFSLTGDEILTVVSELDADDATLSNSLIAVPVNGEHTRVLIERSENVGIGQVAVAEDGALAALLVDYGDSGRDFVAKNPALWLIGPGERRRLTDPEVVDLGEVGSHITPDGDEFLVQNRKRGRVELLRVTREGEVSVELGGDIEVNGHAAGSGQVVAAASFEDSFGELVNGKGQRLTDFGANLRASGIVLPVEHTVPGRDGYPVHGWVAKPEGEGPFPVILQIHGGPYASYAIHPFDETQVLVDAGYAVVYSNPRGSAGYGSAHGHSIRQAMGTVDYFDVMDFLDAVLAKDKQLDGNRVGVMGGSYGGYLTAWIIAHEHRFAGAIVERGFLDPVSFQGTSDIGSFFGDEYVGTDAADMERQSPLAVVANVTTPTLVLHSELDYRCPLEQATRYYSALKRQGTTAEMLIFPGENHELTRGGQPRHRVERFDAVLEWWSRWLPITRS
jgi:dipeptidyl aminopeptidase/acylaminoacyl peptidase